MGLLKKLQIKKGYSVAVLNAPEGFSLPKEEFPEGARLVDRPEGELDTILLFAKDSGELKQFAADATNHLKDDGLLWVAYPKKSSKIKSDISRDQGWDVLKEKGYEGVSLVSVDEKWSAFRFRERKYIKSLNK